MMEDEETLMQSFFNGIQKEKHFDLHVPGYEFGYLMVIEIKKKKKSKSTKIKHT